MVACRGMATFSKRRPTIFWPMSRSVAVSATACPGTSSASWLLAEMTTVRLLLLSSHEHSQRSAFALATGRGGFVKQPVVMARTNGDATTPRTIQGLVRYVMFEPPSRLLLVPPSFVPPRRGCAQPSRLTSTRLRQLPTAGEENSLRSSPLKMRVSCLQSRPVSLSVRLSRPAGRSSVSGAVSSKIFGTP